MRLSADEDFMGTKEIKQKKAVRLEKRKEKSTEVLKNVRWQQRIFKSQQFSLIITIDKN